MRSNFQGILFLTGIVLIVGIAVFWWRGQPTRQTTSEIKTDASLMINANGMDWAVRSLGVVQLRAWNGIDAVVKPFQGRIPAGMSDAAILRGICGALLVKLNGTETKSGRTLNRNSIYRVQVQIAIKGKQAFQFPIRIPVRDGSCISPNGQKFFIPPFPPPLDEWKIFQINKAKDSANAERVIISFAWIGEGEVPPLSDFAYQYACEAVLADPPPSRAKIMAQNIPHISIRAWKLRIDTIFFGFGQWQQRNYLKSGDKCLFLGEEFKA